MNIINNNIYKAGSARKVAVCSVLAIAIAMPATSFAAGGYWSQNRGITKVRTKVKQVRKNVVNKVATHDGVVHRFYVTRSDHLRFRQRQEICSSLKMLFNPD